MFNDGDVITKVWMLLDIIHKATAAGPTYARWAQYAQEELERTYQHFTDEATPQEAQPQAVPASNFEEHPADE